MSGGLQVLQTCQLLHIQDELARSRLSPDEYRALKHRQRVLVWSGFALFLILGLLGFWAIYL